MVAVVLAATGLTVVPLAAGPAFAAPACTAEATSEAAAVAMAKACGHRVEVASGRSEYSQVFAEPSGVQTVEMSVVPKRVRKAGVWVPVSTELRRAADGSWAPAATLADVRFSGGGAGPMVTLAQSGHSFSLSWPTPLPAPRVEGATAVYESVLADTDLRVTATALGFSHVLVLKSRAAAANPAVREIRYRIGGDATVSSTPTGGLRVAAGRVALATAGEALMWDSSAGTTPQERAAVGSTRSSAVSAVDVARQKRVATRVAGGELRLTPDAGLLDDTSATYPMFVDPDFQAPKSAWAYATENNENGPTTDPNIQPGDPNPAAAEVRIGNDPWSEKNYRAFLRFPMNEQSSRPVDEKS